MTDKRLIGGEMEVYPADFREATGASVWPSFGKAHTLRCDTGRSALKLALSDWQRQTGTGKPRVWLPAYICPSVNRAVEQSGLRIMPYEDHPGLDHWSQPPEPVAGDIVLVVHYFGVLNRAALAWVDSMQERAWALVEDCVQAPYTAEAGTRGDYALTSLRKWWPVPDGAVLAARTPFVSAVLSPASEAFVSQRLAAKLLRGRRLREPLYLDWIGESEDVLESAEPRAVSWLSERLLATCDVEAPIRLRRANWLFLAESLKGHSQVRPWYAGLRPGDVPLAFPVLVDAAQRGALRNDLRRSGIYCPVHWDLSPGSGARSESFSRQALSIPIDQRYGLEEMEYVISCINDFFNRSQS